MYSLSFQCSNPFTSLLFGLCQTSLRLLSVLEYFFPSFCWCLLCACDSNHIIFWAINNISIICIAAKNERSTSLQTTSWKNRIEFWPNKHRNIYLSSWEIIPSRLNITNSINSIGLTKPLKTNKLAETNLCMTWSMRLKTIEKWRKTRKWPNLIDRISKLWPKCNWLEYWK